MPRARDPNRDKAFDIWKQHKGGITNRAIAEQLNIDEKKVAVWKQRDKWNVVQQTPKNVVQQKKKGSKNTSVSTEKKRKRNGNPRPQNQFTKRNKAAEKHGLFSKFLPAETLEIIEIMQERSPADLIYDQIEIQYAAIIRAQKIMYVEDKYDLTQQLKKEKPGMYGDELEYEIQFAWDKQANFMNAQSRAMSEFRSLIKQFLDMAHEDDERRLKLEQMQLSVDKSKVELGNLRGDNEGDAHAQANSYVEALGAQAAEVFADEVLDDEEA